MRRFIVMAAVLGSILPVSSAFAGRIFGDIKQDGKPLPAGVMVLVTRVVPPPAEGKAAAAPAPTDTTQTDKLGSYKVVVKEEGKCTLTLVYEKQPVSLEVFSYKEATRYDLILDKKDGKYTLRRK